MAPSHLLSTIRGKIIMQKKFKNTKNKRLKPKKPTLNPHEIGRGGKQFMPSTFGTHRGTEKASFAKKI